MRALGEEGCETTALAYQRVRPRYADAIKSDTARLFGQRRLQSPRI
jgi:hypothetical protein